MGDGLGGRRGLGPVGDGLRGLGPVGDGQRGLVPVGHWQGGRPWSRSVTGRGGLVKISDGSRGLWRGLVVAAAGFSASCVVILSEECR